MMKLLLLIPVLFLFGCNDVPKQADKRSFEDYRKVCTRDTLKLRSQFTLDCIEKANPLSGEEPERWIYKCKNMADDLFCESKTVIVHQTKISKTWNDISIMIPE